MTLTSSIFFYFCASLCTYLPVSAFFLYQIPNFLNIKTNSPTISRSAISAIENNLAIVSVDLGDRSYPIYIGETLLDSNNFIAKHIRSKRALIVSNTKVGPIYSQKVKDILTSLGIEASEIILPDGEEYKSIDSIMKIMDAAIENKLDRKSTLIALGGGVIGDSCGFAASIYQRGIKFIQVPTSLMAMVDSAVGGKTAVNHPKGKNMIGAFYQPETVIADLSTLRTLPDREFRSGLSEIIKYGLIHDPFLFDWLENNIEKVLNRETTALTHVVRRSCEIKASIVASDEKEAGVRALLNLGHTFGHAIEAGFGYGAWLHGEAVAAGTVMAADFSYRMGRIDETLFLRIKSLFRRCQLPIDLSNLLAIEEIGSDNFLSQKSCLTKESFLEFMSMDKKVADGKLNLILLEGKLGSAIVTDKYDAELLASVVSDYCNI